MIGWRDHHTGYSTFQNVSGQRAVSFRVARTFTEKEYTARCITSRERDDEDAAGLRCIDQLGTRRPAVVINLCTVSAVFCHGLSRNTARQGDEVLREGAGYAGG